MSLSPKSKTRSIDFAAWGVVFIFALLFTTYGIADRRTLLNEAGDEAVVIASQTALAADGVLGSSKQLLRAMKVLATAPIDKEEIRRTLLDWKGESKYTMDLLILSGEGKITHWTGNGTPPTVTDRDYFRAHQASNGKLVHVGQPLISKVHSGKWFFAISEDIRNAQGKLQAVVVAILDLNLLSDRLSLPLSRNGNTQVLAGLDGMIYARNPENSSFIGKTVSSIGANASGIPGAPPAAFSIISAIDGKPRIAAITHLNDFPLLAAGSLATEEVLEPWQERLAIVTTLWLLISIGALTVAKQLKADIKLQEKLANTDSLTGIHNRRAILSVATGLRQAKPDASPLSLLMIDIDHFKRINDSSGHAAGDEVLRKVSSTLRKTCRGTDIVGRYGGEEFLVLMPDTQTDGAVKLAEKLRSAVEKIVDTPTPVTISIGVATTSHSGQTLPEALSHADRALYAAKAAGRNCIRRADDQTEPAAPTDLAGRLARS
jgi:diguanylate cyclase (GGDEF)-like protein